MNPSDPNAPTPHSERPVEHQRLIALMQEAKAPPPDAETPPIPDELLARLRERYSTEKSAEVPRRAIASPPSPSVIAWIWQQLIQPKFAFAACSVLLIGVVLVMVAPEDLLRGSPPVPRAVPAFWLVSDKAETAPTGLGMPTFHRITTLDELPKQGDALVFDPAHREARLLRNGKVHSTLPITDPTDDALWLAAHRQLNQQLMLK